MRNTRGRRSLKVRSKSHRQRNGGALLPIPVSRLCPCAQVLKEKVAPRKQIPVAGMLSLTLAVRDAYLNEISHAYRASGETKATCRRFHESREKFDRENTRRALSPSFSFLHSFVVRDDTLADASSVL